MRSLAAVLALALLVAGCGGGGPVASTAPAPSFEPTIAAGLALCEKHIASDHLLYDQELTDCLETARFSVEQHPRAVYPSAHSPDGDWTALELLEWVAANGSNQAARLAQAEIGKLP